MQATRGFLARSLQTIYALEDVTWSYQVEEVREREDVVLLLLNPKPGDSSMFDFGGVEGNFRKAWGVYTDLLQNAKLPLTFGVR